MAENDNDDGDEKKELAKKTEEKRKELQWWQRLSPTVLALGAVAGFIMLRSITTDAENRDTFVFYLIGLVAVLYFLAQTPKAREEAIITPKEAELLVERECERKNRWGQFGPMTQYSIGPVSDIQHRDARGMYYDVAVQVTSPYDRPTFYVAKVMMKGLEKGFVTLSESIGPISGREKVQEKTIIPEWMARTRDYPLLEKLIFREK